MGGHAKCLRLMTRGEGGDSETTKTRLRNTWMFPNTKMAIKSWLQILEWGSNSA